jgi:hypothetical protein
MITYKIISDNCTLGKIDATVTESELEGLNLQALLDGGHLETVGVKTKSQTQIEGK